MTVHADQRRSRIVLAICFVGVIALGLASRKWPWLFPAVLGNYLGDGLWALMVFILFALCRPGARPGLLAASALTTAWLVEASQAWHAPWLDAIRATWLGHMALGNGFDWVDLVAYAVGVFAGWAGDVWAARRARVRPAA